MDRLVLSLGLAAGLGVLLAGAGLTGCARTRGDDALQRPIILATTTSVDDSGLLDVLVPDFQEITGLSVKAIAVGSGKALAMGERGEVDVLLVHAPPAEEELIRSGAALERQQVMHNYFVIVGPPSDPAGIRGLQSAAEAFRRIGAEGLPFVSRGDDSGTHMMERSLWSEIGGDAAAMGRSGSSSVYLETGQGMGATLVIASEKAAYTLTDLGTYLAFREQLRLEVLVPEAPRLLNMYSVLVVSPVRFPGVNAAGGRAFAGYLLSKRAQDIVGEFGVAKYGTPLFIPETGPRVELLVEPSARGAELPGDARLAPGVAH